MKPKHWYMKFECSAWLNDVNLRTVSFAARGLWISMLCVMNGSSEQGYLTVNGRAATNQEIAKILGSDHRQVTRLIAELEDAGVFSRDDRGAIYSRRMLRDAEAQQQSAANGRLGGNPLLIEIKALHGNRVNQGDKPVANAEVTAGSDKDEGQQPPPPAAPTIASVNFGNQDLLGAAPAPAARAQLFRDGLPILLRLTGKSENSSRKLLIALNRAAGENAERVLTALENADRTNPADPVAWLMNQVKTPTGPLPASAGVEDRGSDRCGIGAWIAGLPDVTKAPDPAAPGIERPVLNGTYLDWAAEKVADAARFPHAWRGDWSVLAEWLRDDIDVQDIVLPTIHRIAIRSGYDHPRSLRFFDAAVRENSSRRAA